MATVTLSPLASQIRTEIVAWLTAHDRATATEIDTDPYRDLILDRAAVATANNLRRGLAIQREPGGADPARGDGFYLLEQMSGPERLRRGLVANLAGSTNYWTYQLRHAPGLTPMVEEPTEDDPVI